MQRILFLLFRRLRWPLIVLVITYSIAILGLVLIPGIDDQGNPWRMDFFHAFYFVSFMGSTIGFGEIPYPFTDAQRMWTTVIIYATVITWLYGIGSLLSLLQDKGFRQVLSFARFTKAVRNLQTPFYIICGYGDAGSQLVHELSSRGINCVVIDCNESKILDLEIDGIQIEVPSLTGDAADSETLLAAGIKHPQCRAVIALTGSDKQNLTIAISSKLLTPKLKVICQSDNLDNAANMASFGTDHIIDPFDVFGQHFAMMFHSPSMYLVHQWLTSSSDKPLTDFQDPPRGNWVLCGFGRFGKSVSHYLSKEDIPTTLIEADTNSTEAPKTTIEARGTEADTLKMANISDAVGIIAGTDDDTNNLSIIITARDLNPEIFTVSRQNLLRNNAIFDAAKIHMTMHPETIAAKYILGLIKTPLLQDFLELAYEKEDEWANILLSRVLGTIENGMLETWEIEITPSRAPAIYNGLLQGQAILLRDICTDPRDYKAQLSCIPLLARQDDNRILMPNMSTHIDDTDRLLFCGNAQAYRQMRLLINDPQSLHYVQTGKDYPGGYFWKKFFSNESDQEIYTK
ncbi:MAG: NAD-binding protein [Gammaproteobacteria bacterium]